MIRVTVGPASRQTNKHAPVLGKIESGRNRPDSIYD